jgi:subtilisin family serine protease
MKKYIYILLALILISCGSENVSEIATDIDSTPSSATVDTLSILSTADSKSYKEGELIVKFRSGVTADASLQTHQAAGVSVTKSFPHVAGLEHVKLPEGVSVTDAVEEYMSDPNVEYAEPNYIRYAFTKTPTDTYFDQQWGLNNTGQNDGIPGADIQAPDAWDITTGSGNIIVAIVDTGIDYTHSDLVGNIWQNFFEAVGDDNSDGFPGAAGVDDDGDGLIDEDSQGLQPGEFGYTNDLKDDDDENGYVDDMKGWDFLNEDNDPMDDNGHGTHVGGTAGARGSNAQGVTGVMWNVLLMPLKFLDSDGLGSVLDAIEAVDYAIKNGAMVINASYGGPMFSQAEHDSIQAAQTAGVLFVAAAGNDGANNDLGTSYPARYNLDNIISVAATNQRDERAAFSNFGPLTVDVAAPGVNILSTQPPGLSFADCAASSFVGYDFCTGTSMATPHVSGLAGLLWNHYTGFNVFQIKWTILRYVDIIPSLQGWTVTGGRINAFKALSSLLSPTGLTATAKTSSSIDVTLMWNDNATGEDGYKVERSTNGGAFTEVADIGPNSMTYTDAGLADGNRYSHRVRAYNNIPANSSYSNTAETPIAPSNLSATAVSTNQIDLSWTDNSSNETGFTIERKGGDAGDVFTEIAQLGANVTTYSDTPLDKARTYVYRLRAITGTGSSAYSNEAQAKTLGSSGNGGGGCSIGAPQSTPTALANVLLLLLPFVFIAVLRLKKHRKG